MKFLLRMSALFAFALFGFNTLSAIAQEESPSDIEIELNLEHLESLVQSNEKEIAEWAEKNAKKWESWAERFESKMEKWAENQERHMEKWGQEYGKRWEKWAEKMESGDFNADEMQALLEENLKMLGDMPLGELLESGLQESLGELQNAPWENLGELHELIGGSLELSLRSMEKELKGKLPKELNLKLKELNTKDLQAALNHLQQSLDVQNKNLDSNATEKIVELEELFKRKSEWKAKAESKAVKVLQREWADAALLKGKMNEKSVKAAYARAIELKKSMEHESRAAAAKINQAAKQLEVEKYVLEASKKAMKESKKGLSRYYEVLKKQKSELNTQDTEIEVMRREVQLLRLEIELLKTQKANDKD